MDIHFSAILRSKWTMLSCAFLIMFVNSVVNISVKSTTTDLRERLKCTERDIQTFTVSTAYILSIPLSLYGSLIIHKVGTSKSLILWTVSATIGWIIFAAGVSIKSLLLINCGRFLQGGAFGAMRVSFNAFCVKWFGKKHIALSMGVLRSAHNIAHVVGSMLVLNLFIETWGWTPESIFWRETIGLLCCSVLTIFMWLSAKANYKIQEKELILKLKAETKIVSESMTTNDSDINIKVVVPKRKKTIVFPTEGQVTVIKEKKSSSSIVVAEPSSQSDHNIDDISPPVPVSLLRSNSCDNMEKLNGKKYFEMMCNHLKYLFKNPIFVILIIVVFCKDGTVVCLTGILKRFLKDKFNRKEKEIGFEMGLTKYFGFAAPIAGYIIDKVRHREYFMLFASLCLVFGLFTLYFCGGADVVLMYICLLVISFGQVCYGNSFWPCIASVAGKKYQIVAYGFMGGVTSLGAVVLPQIYGKVVDVYGQIEKAVLVFSILSCVGLIACAVNVMVNRYYVVYADINYLNRRLASTEKEMVDGDGSAKSVVENDTV